MAEEATQTDALLKRAAVLRATGATWAEVAATVGRAEDTVKAWPRLHAKAWREEFEAAEAEAVANGAAKAWNYQEGLVDDPTADPDLRQRAAHSMMAHRAKMWVQRHNVQHEGEVLVKRIVLEDEAKPETGSGSGS